MPGAFEAPEGPAPPHPKFVLLLICQLEDVAQQAQRVVQGPFLHQLHRHLRVRSGAGWVAPQQAGPRRWVWAKAPLLATEFSAEHSAEQQS